MGLKFFIDAHQSNPLGQSQSQSLCQPRQADPHTGYSASSPFEAFTREKAQNDIAHCKSWAELFELGNKALGHDRSEWGDDLSLCAAALSLWQRSAFIIEAHAPIEMSSRTGGCARFCDPMDAKRTSFACAQSMLMHLSNPLPSPNHQHGDEKPLHEAIGLLETEIKSSMESLRDQSKTIAVGTSQSTPKGEEMNFLIGTAAWVAMGQIDQLIEKPFLEPCQGWNDLAARCGTDGKPKSERASKLDRAQIEQAWKDLIQAGQFSYVSCGPMGGIEQGAIEAWKVARSTLNLSQEISPFGISSTGLGGLGVSVNASPIGLYATGAFENYRFNLVFKAPFLPTALHHEWTHALERMCKKSNDASASDGLTQFESLAHSLIPDEQSYRGELDFSDRELSLAKWSLMRSIARQAHANLCEPGRRHAILAAFHAIEQLAPEDNTSISWDKNRFSALLSNFGLLADGVIPKPISKSINKLVAARVFDTTLRQAWREGESSFISVAKALDKSGGVDFGYWRNTAEINARCGEARFASLASPRDRTPSGRLVVGKHVATSHPMHAEREQISKAFDQWMSTCAPMVQAAIDERSRIHSVFFQAEPNHLPKKTI